MKIYANEADRNLIRRYVGKDLWVGCRWNPYSVAMRLVKFISIDGNMLTYTILDDVLTELLLEGSSLSKDERYDIELALSENKRNVRHIDSFELIKPSEVYSTEELQEMLENAGEFVDEFEDED